MEIILKEQISSSTYEINIDEINQTLLRIIIESSPDSLSIENKVKSSLSVLNNFFINEVWKLDDALALSEEQLVKLIPQIGRLNKIKLALDSFRSTSNVPPVVSVDSGLAAGIMVQAQITEEISMNSEDSHKYDAVKDLKDLFQTPLEKHQIYERLRNPKESYKCHDQQMDKDETAAARIVYKDVVKSYKEQLRYRNISSELDIVIKRAHLKNAALSLHSMFPDIGTSDIWYGVQGKQISGMLDVQRKLAKRKLNTVQRQMAKHNLEKPALPTNKRKRIKLSATESKGYRKRPKTEEVPEDYDKLDDLQIKCHGLISEPKNFDTIFNEYADLLIEQNYRREKTCLKKFRYLKTYDGRLLQRLCNEIIKEHHPWAPKARSTLQRLKNISAYKTNENVIQEIAEDYGEETSLLNFLMYLLHSQVNISGRSLNPHLFGNDLIQPTPSQSSSTLVETYNSQALIIIYRSRGEAPEYSLQLGDIQIYCKFDIIDMLILCLKSYYFFDLIYPQRLKNFFCFWEKLFDYGTESKNNVIVDRLLYKLQHLI